MGPVTSVKEIHVETPAVSGSLGAGTFTFTDHYSVFDWGRMPDEIPDKGAALCTAGALTFERLEDAGVPTHYRGVIQGDGPPVPLSVADPPVRKMGVQMAAAPELPYDEGYEYDAYHRAAGDTYLVPLEVVFRNRVPEGSSLRNRTEPRDHGIDHDAWPEGPVDLDEPIVEFSTKYETQDRYLDRGEADRIAGAADLDALAERARDVNRVVTDLAGDGDLLHEDGKIECLYHDGEVLIADVAGTLDENRFTHDGAHVSKEAVRQYHRRTQSDWVDAVSAAKTQAQAATDPDWRARVEAEPDPLPPDVVEAAADLYAAGTNAYCDASVFDAPSLEAAIEAFPSG
jgi:phosphoribosylaminoimidazole-succinocarboxamide synthase